MTVPWTRAQTTSPRGRLVEDGDAHVLVLKQRRQARLDPAIPPHLSQDSGGHVDVGTYGGSGADQRPEPRAAAVEGDEGSCVEG
jgi:hypothetical protein